MGEATARCKQHSFRCCHVPILGSTSPRKRNIQIRFTAKDGCHLATHTADSFGSTQFKGPNQLLKPIITLARVLDLEVIAEGVERGEQLRTLRALGCDMAQGHHHSLAH